ncbi:hypothetical protein NDU88_001192 [Pleurodeles waltl]|uniref:Uncharacterized protein n=1 Tax=Pleurodeles waltl TaxID=8319 RepID=A0AAV7RC98_PLEWA|nr:hypothetical protein NDU88_001192 [Pleurodeles waltl]
MDLSIFKAVSQVVTPLEKKILQLQAQCQEPLQSRKDTSGPMTHLPPGQTSTSGQETNHKGAENKGIDVDAFESLKKAFIDSHPFPVNPKVPGTAEGFPIVSLSLDLGDGDDSTNASDGDAKSGRPWHPSPEPMPARSDSGAQTNPPDLASHMLDPEDLQQPGSSEWSPAPKVATYIANRLRKP